MGTPALIELEGVNGDWITLSGIGMGEQGAHLNTDVDGIAHAPIKTLWTEHAYQEGSTYAGEQFLRRDLALGIWVTDINGESWRDNESRLYRAVSTSSEFKLWITDEDAGTRRYLKLRLSEQPETAMERDPRLTDSQLVILTCTAGDPFWYDEQPWMDEFTTTEDTTDGHFQVGSVTVWNPTDHPAWAIWLLEGPSIPRLPDYSWGSRRYNRADYDAATQDAARKIVMAQVLGGGPSPGLTYGVQVNTKPDSQMGGYQSRDRSYNKRMNGVRFLYPLPPGLKKTEVPVSISKAPMGKKVGLVIYHRHRHPWML